MTNTTEEAGEKPRTSRKRKSGRAGFFALDVRQFEKVQGLGVEEAATYLCLAAGTDQTNTTSSWGVKSIMDRTGLTRAEAKRALRNLARSGLVQPLEVERLRARTASRFEGHRRATAVGHQ